MKFSLEMRRFRLAHSWLANEGYRFGPRLRKLQASIQPPSHFMNQPRLPTSQRRTHQSKPLPTHGTIGHSGIVEAISPPDFLQPRSWSNPDRLSFKLKLHANSRPHGLASTYFCCHSRRIAAHDTARILRCSGTSWPLCPSRLFSTTGSHPQGLNAALHIYPMLLPRRMPCLFYSFNSFSPQ